MTFDDVIGSAWTGARWSPFAETVASCYPNQVPWFHTTAISLAPGSGNVPPRTTTLVRPQKYDILIFGASAQSGDANLNNLQSLLLNVTHMETGIPWVAPNNIGYSPVLSFAGLNFNNPMPIQRLPEVFYFPKLTTLKLDWTVAQSGSIIDTITTNFTLLGVQLIHPDPNYSAPDIIIMPTGEHVGLRSRMPWFASVPFGARPASSAPRLLYDWALAPQDQRVQFLPPVDCDVEIHDCSANFTANAQLFAGNTALLSCKLSEMRAKDDWTPDLAPVTAVFGNQQQIYPNMPFTRPHVVRKGYRTAVVMQNNDPTNQVNRGIITFRGVRRCEY